MIEKMPIGFGKFPHAITIQFARWDNAQTYDGSDRLLAGYAITVALWSVAFRFWITQEEV